jgi:clan AA aspartic protease (TIGR02281 family)
MRGYALVIALSFMLFGNPCVQASDPPNQVSEASVFFNQVLQETKNPVIAKLMQENLMKLQEKNTQRHVEIPLLSQIKSNLAVPVMLDKDTIATFAVDTGATYTVITPRLAQKLGVQVGPETPVVSIITANGTIHAPVVTLDHITVGGIEVHNVKTIIQDMGKDDDVISGLLGINFFKNMELTITSDKLILSTIPSPIGH